MTGQLEFGGAERQLFLMATELRRAGDDVTVACLSPRTEPYRSQLEEQGVPVVVTQRRANWDVARVFALRRLLRELKPDAVCAVAEFTTVYAYGACLFLKPRPRLIAMLRRSALELPFVKRALVRHVFGRADAVCANSEAGRRYGTAALGVPAARIRILRNAVPDRLLSLRVDRAAVRASLGAAEDDRVVVYVGRDAAAKDLPTLCRTLARLNDGTPGFRAWCVGPGLDAPPRDLPDPGRRVSWLGPRTDAHQLIGAADVLLLTSSSEGTPNVVLEAMALGRPVVSSDVGDVPDLLSAGPAGRVADVGDDAALAAAVADLLADAPQRERMGTAGRATILREFTTEAMLRGLGEILEGPSASSA